MDSGRCFPPGFRFHPTDEELVGYYLKRKICQKRHHTDVIGETDVYKCDPEELPGMSKLRTGDRQWFFFSPRDRKYPNGGRSNRATGHGYWKATGKDRIISCGSRAAGIKKTLVFYRGRAPKGERTDWVMHEYTMDEEELKRCTGAKEYYALYKVFKKSGPGPKNGEQYGAPFREEDWDEEDLEVQPFIVGENSAAKSADDTVPVNEIMPENGQYVPSMDDLRDFMNRTENEPITTLPHPQFHNDSSIFEHLLAQQGTETNSVEYSARDIPASVPHTSIQRMDLPVSNFRQTHLRITETPEVSSAPILDTGLTEEEIFGDFLEMDDLLVPCPATENSSHLNGELLLDELDGLNVYDFQDASPILFDGGINDLGQLQSYSGDFGYDIGVTSTVSTSTHQMQQHSTNASEFSYTEGQSYSVGAVESGQEIVPLSNPGSIHENQTLHHVNHRPTGSVETRINQQDDDGNASWFSSAIWSYMESIPTTPASASESTFVNQAFERMSSFGRLRLNARNMNVVSGNNVLPSSGKCRSNWLMFLVSVFGVFCAVLWMFIGTRVRLLG